MKLNRTKNTIKNIIYGSAYKVIAILFPFIIRTITLNVLGIQYLGLNSLFVSVLNVLNLAELGFGTALVYSMYKPLAEDDANKVNALLNLYKKIYRIIGFIVLAVGLAAMPFLEFLISGTYPADINLYLLYSIFLLNSVIGYFFFAYKNAILVAQQRNDIVSKINILTIGLLYITQIIVLLVFKNYYIYIVFLPVSTLATNLVVDFVTRKKFPQFKAQGSVAAEEKKSIKKQVTALFTHRIGYVVQSSIDNICISAFLGLTLLGKYNNYFYIITAIESFLTIIKQSMLAGIGNSAATETVEHNKKIFNKLIFINMWIVGWCSCCLLCLYQPFMRIWVGGENLLSFTVVLSLVALFYLNNIRAIVGVYKDSLGMWWQDRFKPIAISVVNLIGTVICAKLGFFEGVILTTAFAYFVVGLPWETRVLFKHYFKEKETKYYLQMLFYTIVNLAVMILTYFICIQIHLAGLSQVVVTFIICLIVPNLIYLLAYFKNKQFKAVLNTSYIVALRRKIKMLFKKTLKKIYVSIPRILPDMESVRLNKRIKIYKKLNKKYSKFIDRDIQVNKEKSNYVWTCWLQGRENAPELVKVCFNQMEKQFADKQFVVITADNLKDYIKLPDYIISKWQKGIISNTHLSDIIRISLLAEHGGLWIDSTVLCTGNLDKYVDDETDLFVFKNEYRGDKSIVASNWLIYSKKNNPIVVNMRNLLYKYWEIEKKTIDYFFFHILFTIITENLKEEWEKVPFHTNINPHLMLFTALYKKYDKKTYDHIVGLSNFHKLSYKCDFNKFEKDNLYEHILRGNYEEN